MRWIMSLLLPPVCVLVLLMNAGCSQPANSTFNTVGSKVGSAPKKADERNDAAPEQVAALQKEVAGQPNAPAPPPGEKQAKVEQPRKIRYTADLQLIVDDIVKAETELEAAIIAAKGDKAKAEINSSPGSVRTGFWRIRVPVDQLHSFRKAVLKLGEAEKDTLDSEDMTAQYYDLKAHIENRKIAREAMRKLLEKTGERDIKTYLEVSDKLDNLNDEINRKEGLLRLWANLTDLTTVNVTMREKQKYVAPKPPEIAEVPTFGMRADKTFSESWDAFIRFGQGLVLVLIALTPWLPLPLAFFAFLWLVVRAFRSKTPPPLVVVPESPKSA